MVASVFARRAGLVLAPLALAGCGGTHAAPAVQTVAIAARPREPAPRENSRTCAASLRVIRSLPRPLRIVAYVTTGHPKLDAFVDDLRAVLQRLKEAGSSRFDFSFVDATHDEEKKNAKEAGLLELELGVGGDKDAPKTIPGFMGLVLEYGAERDTIKVLSPDVTTGLEYWITEKILEVRARAEATKHRIGVLTGHDEIRLSEANLLPSSNPNRTSIQGILAQYFPHFVLVDVDLRRSPGAPIDETLEGLIITQPATDLADDELRRIDAFVIKGKSLTVVASAVNLTAGDATMRATLSTHGLEKLLGGYGIEMRKDVLEDFGRPFGIQVMVAASNEPSTMRFPPLLDVKDDERFTGDSMLLDTGFPAFFRTPQVPFPYASSLLLHRDKQPDVRPEGFRILARSSPQTARETADTVDLKPLRQWAPKRQFAQYDVAATVEGKLQSAFGQPPGGKNTTGETKRAARVLVLSSSQFFANPFARAGNAPDAGPSRMTTPSGGDEVLQQLAMPYAQQLLTSTILVAKNTLDWMTMDSDLSACANLPNGSR